jgi:hypothetical protein
LAEHEGQTGLIILSQRSLVTLNKRPRHPELVLDDDLTITFFMKELGHDGDHSDGGCNKAKLKHMTCPMARA